MKPRWQLAVLLVAVFICVTAAPAFSKQTFKLQAYDKPVSVMSHQAYQKQFGNNPDIPGDHQEILNLARKLYKPQHEKFAPVMHEEAAIDEHDAGCREYELGLLFAALQNPEVSDVTREMVDSIILQAYPTAAWKTYTSGKFKIYYVIDDLTTAHNITAAEAQSVADYLNSYYNTYVSNFTTPKGYWNPLHGHSMIDVKIYYIDASTLGQTASSWNHIELNSSSCVKNLCKRRTTSAHELFHRVQYAYGYVTGTANMKWMVEGTASYSQKYTNQSLRDYMGRMNSGLSVPDKMLITGSSARSYDACHLWVYLDEISAKYTPTMIYPLGRAIRDVWSTYNTNGKNAKAAVETVAVARAGSTSFDNFVTKWSRANYCKDFTKPASWKLDYTEDESSAAPCSVTYGPLSHVPKTVRTISSNATVINLSGSVSEYGADYYEFNVNPAVTSVRISLNGADTGDFAYQLIPIKSGTALSYAYTYGSGAGNTHTFSSTFTAGSRDKFGLIVGGRSKGGSYTVRVGP